jgi:hypothetical protein
MAQNVPALEQRDITVLTGVIASDERGPALQGS